MRMRIWYFPWKMRKNSKFSFNNFFYLRFFLFIFYFLRMRIFPGNNEMCRSINLDSDKCASANSGVQNTHEHILDNEKMRKWWFHYTQFID